MLSSSGMSTPTIAVHLATFGLAEMGRRIRISKTHLSKIMSGNRKPSLDVAAKIAVDTGVTLDALYQHLIEIKKEDKR